MHWLNFRHLHSFWMVARMGSFTQAAKELHVAQSAVSTQVAALEEYLDEVLLLRSHRSVELTPAGQTLLGYAHSIFAQSLAINSFFGDKAQRISNRTLRVGVVGGASRNFVYRLLDQHLRRSPDLHLSVSTGSYEELYQQLKRLALDAIVSIDLPTKKDLREVSYEKLGESKMCVVATPDLIAKIRKKRTKERIDVFKFRHPFEVDVLDKHVRPAVKGELALRMDTDDIPLLRFFANSGKGVAVVPKVGVLEDLEAGQVDVIELPRCPEINIYGITMLHGDPALSDSRQSLWSPREP